MKFYTTGYSGRDVAGLPALLDAHDAVLADIRFAPDSRHLEWRKTYLNLLLKHRYIHVLQLGNRKYKEGGIQIHNLELGIRLIESWDKNVILMCGCGDLENCHRRIIKIELEKRGHLVTEISDWNTALM